MKKRALLLLISIMLLFSFATGVFAATNITAIKAFLNSGITIQVNGKKFQPKDEKNAALHPIVYNGKTYVPIINYTQALGSSITFKNSGDGIYSISTTSSSEGKPVNETPVTTPSKPTGSATTTKATGSLTSPIPMNQKFTFTSKYTYKEDSYSGTYSCTIKSVKAITRDQIAALGFKKPESNEKIDYVLVDLVWEAKNCKLISASKSYPYKYLSSFAPDIWGSETASGHYIIGGTDYGFDGSISRNISEVTDSKKLNVGMTGSFTAEGKVILPIYKGEENFLVLKDNGQQDYDKSKIHFKLK